MKVFNPVLRHRELKVIQIQIITIIKTASQTNSLSRKVTNKIKFKSQ